jgi:hypothetical protein
MVFAVNKCHAVINAKIHATMVLADAIKAWRLAVDVGERRLRLLVEDKLYA